jgi:hypothetical protein
MKQRRRVVSEWDIGDDPRPKQPERVDRPVRKLWCAVIDQALEDMHEGDPFARRWFTHRNSTFALACHVLNLSPSRIRHTIEHAPCAVIRINQPTQTAEERNTP